MPDLMLNQDMAIYLRAARDELLTIAGPDVDVFKAARAQRLAAGLAQLMARLETNDDAQGQQQAELDALAREAASILETLGKPAKTLTPSRTLDEARLGLADLVNQLASLAPHSEQAATTNAVLLRRIGDLEDRRLQAAAEAQAAIAAAPISAARQHTELPPLCAENVELFLKRSFPERPAIKVENFSRPTGVFSKEIYRLDIIGLKDEVVPAILRRDRNFEIVPTSASHEFNLLNQLYERGLPVARCLAVQYDDEAPLMRPCLLMERLPGKALAQWGADVVTPEVLLQMAGLLARLHQTDTRGLTLPRASAGASGRDLFAALLDEYHGRLRRFQRQPHLIVEAGYAWLRANTHLVDETTTLVHADYDLRNVFYDGERVNAVLDFELSHLGHPAEDLGYLRKDIEHLIPWPDFMAAYHAAHGPPVSDAAVLYFQIWAYVFQGTCNVTAFTGFQTGVHSDVFMGTLPFVEFPHIQNRLVELLRAGA